MANSENSKTAASSTPAAAPAASHAAPEGDALPSRGAERGDMLGIASDLAALLGDNSDPQNDETAEDSPEDTARLDEFDVQQAAQAAEDVAPAAEAGAEEDPAAEGAEGEGDDAPAPADAPESDKKPNPAPADAKKHDAVQARIDELTAEKKSAQELAAQLKEQLAVYKARDEGQLSPDVLEHVDTPEELAATQRRFNSLLTWAIQHPEGGKLGEREYSAEEVRVMHSEALSLIQEAIPARRDYIAQRDVVEREAVNFYPWLKDTTKGAGAQVAQAVQQLPALRKMPNYRLAVADAIVGQALRLQGIQVTDSLLKRLASEVKSQSQRPGQQAPARPQTAPAPARTSAAKPPAAPGRPGVLPPRLSQRQAQAKNASRQLQQSEGSETDLAAAIESKL